MNIYQEIVNFHGAKMIVTGEGKTVGTIGGEVLELLAGKEALKMLFDGSSFFIKNIQWQKIMLLKVP